VAARVGPRSSAPHDRGCAPPREDERQLLRSRPRAQRRGRDRPCGR
jgi:hypothetical protein